MWGIQQRNREPGMKCTVYNTPSLVPLCSGGNFCRRLTSKKPPLWIHFPVIEPVVGFILLKLEDGGDCLGVPVQKGKPGPQGDGIAPALSQCHRANAGICRREGWETMGTSGAVSGPYPSPPHRGLGQGIPGPEKAKLMPTEQGQHFCRCL